MIHRKGPDLQPDQFKASALRGVFVKPHREAQLRYDDAQSLNHALQPRGSPDVEGLLPPGLFQAQQQAGQPRAVIPVEVGQNQALQAPEAPSQPADADLGALSAVRQHGPPVDPDIQGGQRPVLQRQRTARPQQAHLDHACVPLPEKRSFYCMKSRAESQTAIVIPFPQGNRCIFIHLYISFEYSLGAIRNPPLADICSVI